MSYEVMLDVTVVAILVTAMVVALVGMVAAFVPNSSVVQRMYAVTVSLCAAAVLLLTVAAYIAFRGWKGEMDGGVNAASRTCKEEVAE